MAIEVLSRRSTKDFPAKDSCHIAARGNRKEKIFYSNKEIFLNKMKEALEK